MPIKRIHELPVASASNPAEGWLPDGRPRFGQLLAEAWERAREPKPRATPESRFRHSDGGGCARAIAYAALDVPESNPMDLAGVWVTGMGTWLHEAWQAELQAVYGADAEIEVIVGEGDMSGHVDAVVVLPDRKVAIEGKSVGGYAFQLAVGVRGAAEGPRPQAVVQAALNAQDVGADEAVIVYWARDAVSVSYAKRKGLTHPAGRFLAEWTLTRAQFVPIADEERERVAGIMRLLDEDDQLPARKIPGMDPRAVVVRPQDGAWVAYDSDGAAVGSGTTWMCGYCRWQDFCSGTPSGRTPVDAVLQLGRKTDG